VNLSDGNAFAQRLFGTRVSSRQHGLTPSSTTVAIAGSGMVIAGLEVHARACLAEPSTSEPADRGSMLGSVEWIVEVADFTFVVSRRHHRNQHRANCQ
jgi:hypothetical protein